MFKTAQLGFLAKFPHIGVDATEQQAEAQCAGGGQPHSVMRGTSASRKANTHAERWNIDFTNAGLLNLNEHNTPALWLHMSFLPGNPENMYIIRTTITCFLSIFTGSLNLKSH